MNAFIRHLGQHYSQLSPLIKQAHIGTIRLEGEVFVRHGNALARLMCRVLKMPRAGESVQLIVDGFHEEDRMRWHRTFDGHEMRSGFIAQDDFLIEHLGPLKLWLKLAVDADGSLDYHLKRTSLWGIALPKWMAPELKASESEREGNYDFYVGISLPLVGKLIEYGGLIRLLPTPEGLAG